ncbi:TetR/AcrR family transcriptional regulator [Curtobacterium flaccumfaciens pv. flaccumfaciens]
MPDSAPPSELGLRDRKRIETRNRIAEAARSLALEQGVDGTTIEQIAARADVSPRTFFNYFESKEDAVLGHTELDLEPATLQAHLAAVAGGAGGAGRRGPGVPGVRVVVRRRARAARAQGRHRAVPAADASAGRADDHRRRGDDRRGAHDPRARSGLGGPRPRPRRRPRCCSACA